jgi:hypothetical protein
MLYDELIVIQEKIIEFDRNYSKLRSKNYFGHII